MGAHVDRYDEPPPGCGCQLTRFIDTPGWFVTKVNERCGMHGTSEHLADGVTPRQARNSQERWT